VRPRSPSFLSRIAEEIRAPVIALEAEQHYLRVFTEKGRDLILYRFSDAVAEMKDEDGAQVHRSWWVSRAAVERAVKENGAWRLILKDGAEVPVSRTYALAAKQAALIDG
jgi:DNA-binding LytR/AlgR family response regulator